MVIFHSYVNVYQRVHWSWIWMGLLRFRRLFAWEGLVFIGFSENVAHIMTSFMELAKWWYINVRMEQLLFGKKNFFREIQIDYIDWNHHFVVIWWYLMVPWIGWSFFRLALEDFTSTLGVNCWIFIINFNQPCNRPWDFQGYIYIILHNWRGITDKMGIRVNPFYSDPLGYSSWRWRGFQFNFGSWRCLFQCGKPNVTVTVLWKTKRPSETHHRIT